MLLGVLIPVALVWGFNPPKSFHPTEDVANTKHNLSVNDDILADPTKTGEVCVFCHTPHGANKDQTAQLAGQPPLWNRALPDTDQFIAYTSPNFDGAGSTPGKPKGVSLACLSCHDGVVAFDALINAPGSGGFTPGNSGTLAGTDPGIKVFGANAFQGPIVDTDNSFNEGNRPDTGKDADGSPYSGGLDDFVATGGGPGSVGSEPFPNLGRDLSDDHPISMEIPSADPQFDEVIDGADPDGGNLWLLKRTGGNYTQEYSTDKRDVVRAYATATAQDTGMYIECASCHNPHTPRPSFLRIPSVDITGTPGTDAQSIPAVSIGSRGVTADDINTIDQYPNTGSLLCLTCHQK
jgi:cytochrome c553